jgi:hypothetical protein
MGLTPCHICTEMGLALCHICTGTGLTSAPGPASPLPRVALLSRYSRDSGHSDVFDYVWQYRLQNPAVGSTAALATVARRSLAAEYEDSVKVGAMSSATAGAASARTA